jgi:hypothetical protein
MSDSMKQKICSSFKLRRKGLVKKASPVYAALWSFWALGSILKAVPWVEEEYVEIK